MRRVHPVSWLALALVVGCEGRSPDATGPGSGPPSLCDLAEHLTSTAGFPDAIPALTEPGLVAAAAAGHLIDSDRVLGLVVDGEARAYPHPILWSHEVVNDRFGDRWVTVSYCPLTGSGLAIDATVAGRRIDFGVSGLLFANNLVLYDRATEELFGPQMSVQGKCSTFAGASPTLVPVREMSWGSWRALYPHTRVVSDDTGHTRNYRQYPYGTYDVVGNDDLLFPMPVDDSRPSKERVLGIRTGPSSGQGFPFSELASAGERVALNQSVGSIDAAIFYQSADGGAAVAYDPVVQGRRLTFTAESGGWRDEQTGSSWDLSGRALGGDMAGVRLTPIAEAYVAFWFAWRHFQPDAGIWTAR